MIIECPACTTRYDIKAQLPPEGRTVRCAKCSTVWRAMPPIEEEQTVPVEPDDFAGESAARAETPVGQENAGGSNSGEGEASGESWSSENSRAADGVGSGTEDLPVSGNFPDAAPDKYWQQAQDMPPAVGPASEGQLDRAEAEDEQRDSGKVRWFGGFLRKGGAKVSSRTEPGAAGLEGETAAETIPFPRSGPAGERQAAAGNDFRTLDEARAAVRNVFASLGDQRPAASGSVFQVPVTAQADQDRQIGESAEPSGTLRELAALTAEDRWIQDSAGAGPSTEGGASTWYREANVHPGFTAAPEPNAPGGGKDWTSLEDAGEDSPREAAPYGSAQGQPLAAADPGDPDAQLRNALLAHFPARRDSADAPSAPETLWPGDEAAYPEEQSQPAPERFAPAWLRPSAPADEPDNPLLAPEEEVSEASGGDPSFDPRLYREIEETQEHAQERKRREGTGGLALAAAWGLFLCVAAGLTVGFVAFRDIAADALPGLAPLYRALGMPVTVQPLIFEGVQYEWGLTENKPTLIVRGAVYNRANRKVKVPDFVISIKDEDPALDREYSANLQVAGSKFRPDRHADFEIELLSPNTSITAVELELRNVR